MKKILQKILEEINKEKPRLDYIRGLIEASIEEETSKVPDNFVHPDMLRGRPLADNQKVDEEKIPEIAKVGPIGGLS